MFCRRVCAVEERGMVAEGRGRRASKAAVESGKSAGKICAINRTFTPSGISTSYVIFREHGVNDEAIDLGRT